MHEAHSLVLEIQYEMGFRYLGCLCHPLCLAFRAILPVSSSLPDFQSNSACVILSAWLRPCG
ncbi:hypothetical protein ElyMa_005831200, partial [Elysia marginata]